MKINLTRSFLSASLSRCGLSHSLLGVSVAALLLSACATPRQKPACPFELSQVLSECELPDVAPLQAVAWRRIVDDRPWTVEKVVLAAKRHGGYLLIAAGRNPGQLNPNLSRWSICRISVMSVGGHERWIIGQREFSHYPNARDLAAFLDYIWWDQNQGFRVEFEGRQPLRPPGEKRTTGDIGRT